MSADRINWRKVMDPSELQGYSALSKEDQRLVGDSLRALKKRASGTSDGTLVVPDSFEYKPNINAIDQVLHQAGIDIKSSAQRTPQGIKIQPKTFEEIEAEKVSQSQRPKPPGPRGSNWEDFFGNKT